MKTPPEHTSDNRSQGKTLTAFAMLLLLLGIFLFPMTTWAEEPEILYPPAKTIIHAKIPSINIIVRQKDDKTLGQMQIKSGDVLFAPQGTWSSQGFSYQHFSVSLKPGKNSFELRPSGKNLSITYNPLRSLSTLNLNDKSIYLFHRNEVLPESCAQCHDPKKIKLTENLNNEAQPLCFSCHKNILGKTPWQHSPAVNKQCLTCHKESGPGSPLKISIPGGKVENLCFRCHVNEKAWLQKSHIHGPVGTGDCTICHNPHGDINRFQLWANGKDELCVACHTDKKNLVSGKKPVYYVHGILNGIGCIACHDPHATDNPFQLYKPINDLCTGCHTSLKGVTRGHPVGGHPVSGTKDPRRPERTFTCTSCHNPHGSDFKFLLIGDILGGQICSQCHY